MATNLVVHVFNGDVEGALRQLKKGMMKTGLLKEMRKRAFYQKPSQRRNIKSLVARKKLRKAQGRILAKERNDERTGREITSRRAPRGAAA